jgi:HK97 family phage prohead protease
MTTVRMKDLAAHGFSKQIEFRRASAGSDEIVNRAKPSLEGRTVTGYALMFDRLSGNLGGFIEKVDAGALNRDKGRNWPGINGAGVLARFNHDDNYTLGSTASGTLRLDVDSFGLRYSIDPPKTRADVVELVQRGDVRKSSFAFVVREQHWSQMPNGHPVRTLDDIELIDVAPVTIPAYEDTSAALRSLATLLEMDLPRVRRLAVRNQLGAELRRAIDGPRRRVKTTELVDIASYRRQLERKRVAA